MFLHGFYCQIDCQALKDTTNFLMFKIFFQITCSMLHLALNLFLFSPNVQCYKLLM